MTYDLGAGKHRFGLGDSKYQTGFPVKPINDNKYHVIKFWREGPNATLHLDGENATFGPRSECYTSAQTT